MSAAANWSYTSKATVWPRLERDDWTGALTYGPPSAFACDYSSKAMRSTDAGGSSPLTGVELALKQVIYTERADIKQGDMLLIGASATLDPIAAGAVEVRTVTRDADTFDGIADDYAIET